MKVFLIGSTPIADISKKSGKPYDMSKFYSVAKLDSSDGETKGHMGSEYKTTAAVVRSTAHLDYSFFKPLEVELELEELMRYGNKETMVVAVHPVKPVVTQPPKAIPPAPAVPSASSMPVK